MTDVGGNHEDYTNITIITIIGVSITDYHLPYFIWRRSKYIRKFENFRQQIMASVLISNHVFCVLRIRDNFHV